MAPIIDSVLRAGEGRLLRKLKRISEQVNSIEDEFVAMSDADLRGLTDEFRQRYADGETLDELLPEAFATAREAVSGVPPRMSASAASFISASFSIILNSCASMPASKPPLVSNSFSDLTG